MTALLYFSPRPHLLFSPSTRRSKSLNPLLPFNLSPKTRGELLMAKSGFSPHLTELETAVHEVFGRAEGFVYTIADAVVSSATDPAAVLEESKKSSDWLSGITNYMETVLKILKDGLSAVHVPYAYGFAIILLTVLVKAATFPLTKKQVESTMAMRSLQPQVKAIQQRYAGDQERIQLETARLYKLAGVNPLAGCLPTLATIPVWIGLYRALSNVADEGLLTEGFFWIPSLSGPTTIAARQSGSGISWLFPFVDGQPPLGWQDTLAYLVLPILLVVSQYISAQVMQPQQSNDPSQKSAQTITKLLPLMIGYFSLSVPSGLSLYWFTNNILSTAQQIWLQKLGGAKNPVRQFTDDTSWNEPSDIDKSTSNIQKSVLEDTTEKVKSSQEIKADSVGLRPGERFKQLKEEEERRRLQRQEDKRREEKRMSGEASVDSGVTTQQRIPEDSENSKSSIENNGGFGSRPAVNGRQNRNVQKEQVPEMGGSSSSHTSTDDPHGRRDHEPEKEDI